MPHPVRALSVVVLCCTIAACAKTPELAEVKGPCADVYKGQVCTWAKMQGADPVEMGATVAMASIENAPSTEGEMKWPPVPETVLDIPEAARQGSGFTHFTMYWEASGHAPAPFMQPHFDFHFYRVPNAERMAIDCVDTSKPATLPAGYELHDEPLPPDMAKMMGVSALVGICVPEMGMHALPADEVAGKTPFRGDMVIGYFKAKPVFIEPMITKAMLMEKKSFDLPIAAVPGLTGVHPSKFHAEYDAAQQSYRFTFSGFTPAT
ncbi:MAG: hypothetical protein HY084_02640 [Gemmatimonadetes bacterium]|nr:hypothetical protein [Gemmatimonadota bacterium]